MLNNEYPPLGGGTGTVNQAVLQRLAQVPELEIDLITSALGKVFEKVTLSPGVRILKVPVNNRNIHHSSNRELITFAVRSLSLALKEHRRDRYDLCFAWSAVPAGGVALVLKRMVGLPYIVRVCGPDIPGFERRYRWLYPILTPLIRLIWRGARTVVAKCGGEADMIRAVDNHASITLIPNGVDLSAFRPGEPIPAGGPLRLLCVGRLIERKGQHHLIYAVKRLADDGVDVTLDLVGTGDAEPGLKALTERLGLGEKVRFHGYVPREEIARFYANAHVFVLPSYNEGMSVATLEAMAAGLPVIATRTPGTDELVIEGENGLTYTPGDIDALVVNLEHFGTDRTLASEMGVVSRNRAALFSWKSVVDRYRDLFEQVPSHSSSHTSLATNSKQIN